MNPNEYSYQSGDAQSNEQINNSIFDNYDKHKNNIVDEADFDNNKLIVQLLRQLDYLDKDWNEVGYSVIALLKDLNVDDYNNFNIEVLHDRMEKMTEECDISNGANLVKTLNMVNLVDHTFWVLARHIEKREDFDYYRKEIFKNIFKDNYEKYSKYRDGGSLKINLKYGTKVIRPKNNEYNGWVSIGYENGVLEVEFNDRSIYHYYNADESLFYEFLNAPSKGKFVHEVLRRYGYPYQKIA